MSSSPLPHAITPLSSRVVHIPGLLSAAHAADAISNTGAPLSGQPSRPAARAVSDSPSAELSDTPAAKRQRTSLDGFASLARSLLAQGGSPGVRQQQVATQQPQLTQAQADAASSVLQPAQLLLFAQRQALANPALASPQLPAVEALNPLMQLASSASSQPFTAAAASPSARDPRVTPQAVHTHAAVIPAGFGPSPPQAYHPATSGFPAASSQLSDNGAGAFGFKIAVPDEGCASALDIPLAIAQLLEPLGMPVEGSQSTRRLGVIDQEGRSKSKVDEVMQLCNQKILLSHHLR